MALTPSVNSGVSPSASLRTVSGSTELAEVLSNCLPNPFGKLRGESFGFAQDSERLDRARRGPVELLAEPLR